MGLNIMKDEKAPKSDEISSNERINEMSTCFIGLSEQTRLFDDVINACQEILPRFGLKPCYAHDHFDPRKSLQDTVVEMISHADYGIYDLSHWQGKTNDEWIMPRNVFIELGIAIALNRPILLLQDTESIKSGPRLPECLEGIRDRILPFSGPYKLKKALERSLPQLVNESPDQDWNKRHCVFGKRACEYREAHPFAKDWFVGDLPCLISDGKESDRDDFRNVIEEVFGLYSEVSYNYLDELPIANGYKFLLCTYCQTVRSTPYGIYRITPLTPGETFIDIGISIALEAEFKHKIPKILLTRNVQDVPSILKGYRVVVAQNSTQCKKQLLKFLPEVHQIARRTIVRSQPLPYIQVSLRQREKFNSTDKSSSNIEQEETSDNLKVEQEVIEIQEQASTSEPIGHHAKSIHSSIPARNVFLLGRPGSGKSMV